MTIIVLKMTTKRSKMTRFAAAHRIGLVLIFSLFLIFMGCESQKGKGTTKEPVVTKQIAKQPVASSVKKTNPQPKNEAADPSIEPTTTAVVAAAATRMPYNSIGKVDPFTPLYKEEAEKKAQAVVVKPKGPERPRTPLEKLDLGQLKLTAIVTTKGYRRALVEEATGKGYVVTVGTKIGLERGTIIEIEQERIVIEHQTEDDFGKAASQKRELKLQKPPGD
jgi:type IV pilus assembly protein PilP